MTIAIRDVGEHDLDSVLALNNSAGQSILPLDAERVRFFMRHADYFRVAEVDGQIAGFLIALRPGTPYGSSNYRWFCEQFEEFLYIDRIVVAGSRRGAGLGRVFYADVTSYAEVRVPILACEVFLEPRNDAALLFHGTYGFREVGQHLMAESGRQVSLLVKDLPSFAFVRDNYLGAGGLPEEPWLISRTRLGDVPAAIRASAS
ncbi:MAG: GNAT family N-acetyltransferase [Aquimonas sp.]|nr:GNAT family N-acetyltransferase [Aquimonas sp.]